MGNPHFVSFIPTVDSIVATLVPAALALAQSTTDGVNYYPLSGNDRIDVQES